MSTTEIIQVNPTEYGIAENKATELIGNLPQIQGERKLLEQSYEQVILLDIEDKETSKKAKAPIKKQLTVWVEDFKIAELNLENEKKTLIVQKFEAFKKWAKFEIESI